MKVAFLRYRLFSVVLIMLLGMLSYSNTFNDSFHFDDFTFIVENPSIKNIDDIQSIFKTILPQSSRFVCFLTFALNYKVHGLDVFGYHLTNLMIHLVSAVLVWWLVLLLCSSQRSNSKLTEEEEVDIKDLEIRLKIYKEFSARGKSLTGEDNASSIISSRSSCYSNGGLPGGRAAGKAGTQDCI